MLSDRFGQLMAWRLPRSNLSGRDSIGASAGGARRRRGCVVALTLLTVLLPTFDPGAAATDDDPIVVTPSEVEIEVGDTIEFSGSSDQFPIVDPYWETDTRFGTISVNPDDSTRCTFTATAPGEGYIILWEGGHRGGTKGSADITVTVGGSQQLDSIVVSPASVNLEVGEQQLFAAVGYDSNGDPMVPPVTPVWSTDGGSITQEGVYSAPETEGSFTVTAGVVGSSVVGTATVTASLDTAFPPWVWVLVVLGLVGLGGTPLFLLRRRRHRAP